MQRIAADRRDADAEAELCRMFAPRVRLYGLRHLRDEERARDLVQSVLVAVIEAVRAGRIEDAAHIDRFVLGTARHIASRMRTVEGRLEPASEDGRLELATVMPSFARLDVDALLHCLGQLEPRAHTVLQLSFYRDKSAEEIATVLATTANNVRVVRHRAITQLRDCLGVSA